MFTATPVGPAWGYGLEPLKSQVQRLAWKYTVLSHFLKCDLAASCLEKVAVLSLLCAVESPAVESETFMLCSFHGPLLTVTQQNSSLYSGYCWAFCKAHFALQRIKSPVSAHRVIVELQKQSVGVGPLTCSLKEGCWRPKWSNFVYF